MKSDLAVERRDRFRRVAPPLLAALLIMSASSASADVIFEDKGLYKKDSWNVDKYYDDLDDPTDAPGVVTSGSDPRHRSGPAVDFERRSGALPDKAPFERRPPQRNGQ